MLNKHHYILFIQPRRVVQTSNVAQANHVSPPTMEHHVVLIVVDQRKRKAPFSSQCVVVTRRNIPRGVICAQRAVAQESWSNSTIGFALKWNGKEKTIAVRSKLWDLFKLLPMHKLRVFRLVKAGWNIIRSDSI